MDRFRYEEILDVREIPSGAALDIFGAGGGGAALADALRAHRPDCRVERFVDSFQGPGECRGLPLVRADSIRPEEYGGKLLIVASCAHRDIVRRLCEAGHSRVLVYRPDVLEENERAYALTAAASRALAGGGGGARVIRDASGLDGGVSYSVLVLGPEQAEEARDACVRELRLACGQSDAVLGGIRFAGSSGQAASLLDGLASQEALLLYDLGAGSRDLLDVFDKLRGEDRRGSITYWKRPGRFESRVVAVHEKKVLYLPIPKSGSSSMVRHLRSRFDASFQAGMPDHRSNGPDSIFCAYSLGDPAFADYFRFTIVRNPFNRLASLYHSFARRADFGAGYVFRHLKQTRQWRDLSFRSFCEMACACPDEFAEHHLKSQSHFLGPEPRSMKVFHLERLREEAGDVLESLGIGLPGSRANESNGKRLDYVEHYDPDGSLRSMVRERYRADYENFEYA